MNEKEKQKKVIIDFFNKINLKDKIRETLKLIYGDNHLIGGIKMPYMYVYKSKDGLWHSSDRDHEIGEVVEERKLGGEFSKCDPDPPENKMCLKCFPYLAKGYKYE